MKSVAKRLAAAHGRDPDFKATTLSAFIMQNVAAGSTIYTDGLRPSRAWRKQDTSTSALAAAENRFAQGCQVGGASGRPRQREPPAMVDRTYHGVSRPQLKSTSMSSSSEQSAQATNGRLPDAAGLGAARTPTTTVAFEAAGSDESFGYT